MSNAISWLTDSANWHDRLGTPGIPAQLAGQLEYSLIALAIAGVIAFPLGLVLGHTNRATFLINIVNAFRALPTLGLLILFYVLISPHINGRGDLASLLPTEIVLVLLALPPILGNTFAGVRNVEPAVRNASTGMGMTSGQVLFRVELPNALPLVFSGLRSATLQVIATATVAAYVGLGGLGRFLYDGLASHDFAQMTGGAILVAALALAADFVLAHRPALCGLPRRVRQIPQPIRPFRPARPRRPARRSHGGARGLHRLSIRAVRCPANPLRGSSSSVKEKLHEDQTVREWCSRPLGGAGAHSVRQQFERWFLEWFRIRQDRRQQSDPRRPAGVQDPRRRRSGTDEDVRGHLRCLQSTGRRRPVDH